MLVKMTRLNNAYAKLSAIQAMEAEELIEYVHFDLALAYAEINGGYALVDAMMLIGFSDSLVDVSKLMKYLVEAKDRLLVLKQMADERMAHLEDQAEKLAALTALPASIKTIH